MHSHAAMMRLLIMAGIGSVLYVMCIIVCHAHACIEDTRLKLIQYLILDMR